MSAINSSHSTGSLRHEVKDNVETHIKGKLASSPYAPVRRVSCEYNAGILTLRGEMPSFYSIQVALSLVRANLDGNILIRNCLCVSGGVT